MEKINPEFKVKANDFEFTFDQTHHEQADIIEISQGKFQIIHEHKNYQAIVKESDNSPKILEVEIGGEIFSIEIKDRLDNKMDQMGLKMTSARYIKEVKAPMPGLVLEVDVKPGQEVAEGEKLLILSAMKMENSILIHAAGTIKKVCVAPGDAVVKGQVLIELE